jgi:O-antigen/teichoic acid export membrane protein
VTLKGDQITSPSPEEASLGSILGKFIANMSYGGVRGGVLFVNTLVLTPMLIFGLGKEQFAVLALATPFLRYGFNGVFDLGLATGLVRFISRDSAGGDHRSINRYFASALLLYAGAGISLLVLYRFVSPFALPWLLGRDMRLYATAQTTLWHLLWIYVLLLLANPFFALLMGVQKVHLSHVVGTASLLVEFVGILALVPFGLTISRVVLVYAIGAIFSAVFCFVLALRQFSHLELRLELISAKSILDLVHYAARWSVTVSTSLLSPVIDKLILARFVGLSSVAIYEAAARLVEILKRVTQLVLLPLFPLAGAMVPNQSNEETQTLYRRVFGGNMALNAGLYLIPATLAFGIMGIWLGPELSRPAGWAFCILAITHFLLALIYPAVLILAGTGRLRLLVTTGVMALSLNFFLSPVLAGYFGFGGLLAGTLAAYGGQSILILVLLQRQKEFSLHLASSLRMGVITVSSAVAPGLILVTVFGRQLSAATLAALGIFNLVIYCLAVLTLEENRRIAVSVTSHGRKMIASWIAGRRTGDVSQA